MITIAVINQKGGVGKTTTTLNLAAQSSLRHKTLIVDCDIQSNLTRNLDKEGSRSTIRDLFTGNSFETVNVRKNLDLLPSTKELIGIELIIQDKYNREKILEKGLSKIAKDYDYCFIDCPPNIGLVTVNVLACADYVIIPITSEAFSIQGLETMLPFVEEIREEINTNLTILGFVLTMYDNRLTISRKVQEQLKSNGWDIGLFKAVIRRNISIANAQFEQKTVFEYDKNSNGARDYMALGKEVLTKIKKLENGE